MIKIHSGAAHKFDRNIVQPPKTEKENKALKVQPQPSAPYKATAKPPEQTTLKNTLDGNILKQKLQTKLNAFTASKTAPSEVKAATAKASEVKVTYVSSHQRHKGVSKYDNLPSFSNIPAGVKARYRAINPKDGTRLFPLKEGKHTLVDGNGVERGTISGDVKLNYAQVKQINGEDYYYVLGKNMTDKDSKATIGSSGWVKASAIKNGNDPKFDKNDVAKSKTHAVSTVHGKHKDYQQYVVQNIAPEKLTGKNGKPKYGYMEKNEKGKDEFVSYKVLPGVAKDERVAASDYLRRPGNVINMGFNAAGVSNDTFKVDGADPIVFHRAPTSVKSATVDIDIYRPNGEKPVGKMRFVYGYVETQGKKEWGWMALGALKPKN